LTIRPISCESLERYSTQLYCNIFSAQETELLNTQSSKDVATKQTEIQRKYENAKYNDSTNKNK